MEELHSKNTGSVDEWFKSTVLKTVDSKGSVSSNLTTSAKIENISIYKNTRHNRVFLYNSYFFPNNIVSFPESSSSTNAPDPLKEKDFTLPKCSAKTFSCDPSQNLSVIPSAPNVKVLF